MSAGRAPMAIAYAQRAHLGCRTIELRDVVLLTMEQPVRRRRGRPKREAPLQQWLGYCARCMRPRLFNYKPQEQLELPVHEAAAEAAASPGR